MALADRSIICESCGQTFAWTLREQAYYAEKGMDAPRQCGPCTAGRPRVSVPVTRERVLRWLRDERMVPARVSDVCTVGPDGRSSFTLQERDGPRVVELPLTPEEALVAAIWLEPDPARTTLPATSHEDKTPPRALAVCLEAVWPMRPAMAPRGYRLVLLMPGGLSGQRLSMAEALSWILQDHTPLLIDEWLFALERTSAWPWPPAPGSSLHEFLMTLEALRDL